MVKKHKTLLRNSRKKGYILWQVYLYKFFYSHKRFWCIALMNLFPVLNYPKRVPTCHITHPAFPNLKSRVLGYLFPNAPVFNTPQRTYNWYEQKEAIRRVSPKTGKLMTNWSILMVIREIICLWIAPLIFLETCDCICICIFVSSYEYVTHFGFIYEFYFCESPAYKGVTPS